MQRPVSTILPVSRLSLRACAWLVVLSAASAANAMPIHIGNVVPASEDDDARYDIAIGREIVARDLAYRDVVSVDGWPGPNAITVYRAGSSTAVASGFIAPPPSAPISALERGYTVLIARDADGLAPRLVVAEEAPVSAWGGAPSDAGAAWISFAAPAVGAGASTAVVSTDCTATAADGSPRRTTSRSSLDARVGRNHRVIDELDPAARCSFVIEIPGQVPLVAAGLPPAQGRTLRVVVIGDGIAHPLSTLVLYAGVPQQHASGPDPLASVSADSLWEVPGSPGIGYVGGDPAADAIAVGFLLFADEAGRPRWLLLVMGPADDDGTRAVTVNNAARPDGEAAYTAAVGTGSARIIDCNRYELQIVVGEATITHAFERSVPTPQCAEP
jgi:hypothetical protein